MNASPKITTTQTFSRRALEYLMKTPSALAPKEYDFLKCLKANKNAGGSPVIGTQNMTYGLSRKSKAGMLGYGRLYGTKSSIDWMQKEVRATLCGEYYHDLDMVNAHPTLLVQYAEREWSHELPFLADYVANRDDRLKTLAEERDIAKEMVIKVMFGGKPADDSPAWLLSLSKEGKRFTEKVIASGKHSELWAASQQAKGSIYGSFMGQLLQTEERKCMLAMREHLQNQGWSVDVLVFDGVMVKRREDATITEDLLVETAHAIKEATGYTLSLIEKKMVGFDVPVPVTDARQVADGITLAAYQEMKERFEVNHFYFRATDRICEFNPSTGKLLQMGKEHAAMALMAEWSFQTGATEINTTAFLPLWCKDPTRRTIDSIDLKPSEDPKVFSTFNGFPFEKHDAPADAADRVALFNQLLDTLAPEPEMRSILVEWMAHLIQKPFENSMTCMVLAGGKGCGKDTLGDLLSLLIGDKYTQNYDSTDQFWDKHDESRMGRIFVKLEEAVGATNRKYEAAFKARITSATMTVNPKGISPITTPNYARYMLTTNDMSPVKLDAQERRFVVIECGSSKIGDMAFWSHIRKQLFTPEGQRAVGDWLSVQPIGAFPRVLPKSEMALDMIDTEIPSEQRFLESGEWDGHRMNVSDLFALYKSWCQLTGFASALNTQTFGRRLQQQKAEGRIRSIHTATARMYERDAPAVTQPE
jgi:hypothetical protein